MKLPNSDQAVVDERKLRDYLLSSEHPIGKFKAAFFRKHGIFSESWKSVHDQLLAMAGSAEVERVEQTRFGRKYLISGILRGDSEHEIHVWSVWVILHGDDKPRLVAVYPRWE